MNTYVLLTALEQTQLKTVIRHLVSHPSDLRVLQRCVSKNASVYIEYTAKKRAKSRFESICYLTWSKMRLPPSRQNVCVEASHTPQHRES